MSIYPQKIVAMGSVRRLVHCYPLANVLLHRQDYIRTDDIAVAALVDNDYLRRERACRAYVLDGFIQIGLLKMRR